jgi:hypothetical protein
VLGYLSLATAAYLVAYGARTPVLALRGLLRLDNLVAILAPAVAIGALAWATRDGGPASVGILALAVVPAPLIGPEIVTRVGHRGDLAGALALGTVVLSVALLFVWGGLPTGQVLSGAQVFVLAALVAGALPTMRDAVLRPLRWLGWVAFAVSLSAFALGAPALDGAVFAAAAAALLVGLGVSWLVARLIQRDAWAVIAGGGLRDPALAGTVALLVGGPDAAAVPLVYAVMLLVLAAVALRALRSTS